MAQLTVHSSQGTQNIEAKAGETVMAALGRAGIYLDAPCGGHGHCGKCRVICHGPFSAAPKEEEALLTPSELQNGMRLACFCIPEGDAEVTLPGSGSFAKVQTGFLGRFQADGGHTPGSTGIAVDIGTTTVAMYWYDLNTGRLLGERSAINQQRAAGADVISRINACETDPRMLGRLCDSMVNQLNEMLEGLLQSLPGQKAPSQCIIAGNTTMLHLLAALDPSGIAHAPFTPQSLFGTEYQAGQLGIHLDAVVYLPPCISAYVGGDITAGLTGCGLDKEEGTALFVDIGTNGEMALSVNGAITCCSTAAGPAFEGAHIKHGTGSIPGAIDRVWLDEAGKVRFTTIGGAAPAGICGSGLIDAAAVMLQLEVLDETGFLEEDFVLDQESGIAITPPDIREIQLAKSAVAAGLQCLVSHAGLTMEQIDRLLVAGGFGSHMNPASAVAIGLLPKACAGRITAVGNAAGLGASAALLSADIRRRLEELPENCRYIELSGDAEFQDLFIENMMFEE